MEIHSGADVVHEDFAAQITAGRMDLPGLSLPGNWAGPGPEAAVLPGKCMGSLNNTYASIKDL